MLSGLKFVPRDQIEEVKKGTVDDSRKKRRKPRRDKEKRRSKKSKSRYSSSEEESLEKIKRVEKKKKKWYDSNEESSSCSDESCSQSESDSLSKNSRKSGKKQRGGSSKNEGKSRSKKKSRSRKKEYSLEDESLNGSSESEESDEERRNLGSGNRTRVDEKKRKSDHTKDKDLIGDSKGSASQNKQNNVRKEMGLEWMLRPKETIEKTEASHIQSEKVPVEQMKKDSSRELNPYLKDNGSGYPEESERANAKLLSSAVVGDGGASWRLKALKRAQEQATREGQTLQDVVEERWGSMGKFAASVASRNVAPTHAHLHAIKHRRKGLVDEEQTRVEKDTGEKSKMDVTPKHNKMRLPKVQDSLSWGRRGKKQLSVEDAALVSNAISSLNKFSSDGSFMDGFSHHKKNDFTSDKLEGKTEPVPLVGFAPGDTNKEESEAIKPGLSANQLAAKVLQLRMKGKHDEAETLMKEAEKIKAIQSSGEQSSGRSIDRTTSRIIMHDVSARQKKKEEDADLHLANRIMHNHRYNVAGAADEEYDYDDGPKRKTRKKSGDGKSSEINNSSKRILTQQERCLFCFDNPSRPKHLIIAIANFTYLSLPQRQSVVPGHCGILTLQHELSSRNVDDNVWDEIRNFKKCLIMMFGKQDKEVVFLETVMGLGQQKRHCMLECLPLPRQIAKQAPVYFKKAIDEVEDEWSQHNAKKLIDTSEKGLRASIPKNFPYFHVEFGLNRGFVHVIDNEREFKSNFGINVIRGILQLPAEDMHGRQRHESSESQRQSAANFIQDWGPFDWTKELG